MEQKQYLANADDAQQRAQTARREADRQFWLNVARAWTGLVMCLPMQKSKSWFGASDGE